MRPTKCNNCMAPVDNLGFYHPPTMNLSARELDKIRQRSSRFLNDLIDVAAKLDGKSVGTRKLDRAELAKTVDRCVKEILEQLE